MICPECHLQILGEHAECSDGMCRHLGCAAVWGSEVDAPEVCV